jgi:2-alkyl-3-oxoalkanoate reductase
MRIVVTGASGFIGSHLCQRLHAAGHNVAAAVRESSDRTRLTGIEPKSIDLLDQQTLRAAFAGADAVVHCAAVTNPFAGPWEARAVTWIGTFNVCHAAVDAGVSHIVQMSTTAVYARDMPQGVPMREDSVRFMKDPQRFDTYSPNKAAAERCVRDFGRNARLRTTILRAALVYGPHDHVSRLAASALRSKRAFFVHSPSNRLPAIFVADVVAAVEAALSRPPSSTRDYHLAPLGSPSIGELFTEFATALGVELRAPVIPFVVAQKAAVAFETWWTIRKKEGSPPLNRLVVEGLARDTLLDSSRAEQELGWRPTTSVREGAGKTASWLLSTEAQGRPPSTSLQRVR